LTPPAARRYGLLAFSEVTSGHRQIGPEVGARLHRIATRLRPAEVSADGARPATPPKGEILVGREAELRLLEGLLAEAKEGRGHIVFVTGEPGIGKTTLTNELLRRARQDPGLTVARGRCVEHYGAGEAYLPILDVMGALLSGPARGPALEILRTYAPSWCLQLPAAAPNPQVAETLRQHTVGVTRERMLREVVDYVTGAATHTFPIVLLLEDLHWADPSSIDAVRAIANRIARLRLLIVATFRPSDAELTAHPVRTCRLELAGQAHVHEIDLGFLKPADVRRYLDLRFAPNRFPAEFPDLVHARTEGHPLFVANLVDFLCARGDVETADGTWILKRPVGDSVRDVPEGLQAVIRRKIESLSEADRQALQSAAVIGRDFHSTVLARVLAEDELELEERLQRLERLHRLVDRKGEEDLPDGSPATLYRFAHALYQQVVYEDLVSKRRARYHIRAGEALLECYRDEAPRIASALANHFERGRDFVSALTYRIHAGDNAARLYAFAEAIENYDQAFLLAEKLPEDGRAGRLLTLHHKRGAVQHAAGRFDRAAVDFTLMRGRAQAAGDLTMEGEALTGLCYALFFAGRIEEMAVRAHEALGLCAQGGGERLRVFALLHVAAVLEAEGRLAECVSLLDEVVDFARRIGLDGALAGALAYKGTTLYWKCAYRPAEEIFVEGAEAAARAGDGFVFLCCRMFRDLCRMRLGRISEALAGFEETTELARRNGDRFWLPRLLAHQGFIRRELQIFEGTPAFSEAALRIAREDRVSAAPETEALLNLSLDYVHAGRASDGERMLCELEQSTSSLVQWLDEIRLRAAWAEHWLVRGDVEAARTHAQQFLELTKGLDALLFPTWAHRILCEIALAEGRPQEAASEALAALDDLKNRPAPLEAWRILSTLARARAALGDPAGAAAAFREARAVVSSIAASIQEEPLRAAFLGSPAVRTVMAGNEAAAH
jgi:tetratricopeptide (TPR) repeat protein